MIYNADLSSEKAVHDLEAAKEEKTKAEIILTKETVKMMEGQVEEKKN